MNLYATTFRTSYGPFSLAVDDDGAVIATAFGDVDSLRSRIKNRTVKTDTQRTRDAREQLLEYFAGERIHFTLPLAPIGTEFQQSVWSALQEIPPGETRTYGQLAAQLGNPNASRAVGRANATNPICVIIPCHRVIGSDGSLTGFAFGEEIKQRLLDAERSSSKKMKQKSATAAAA